MVWKDLFFGFLVAGGVAALVPDEFFQAIFPRDLPVLLLVPVHALLGPVLAIFTVIGSIGNGPLAAILWENGIAFSRLVAFLFADFVVIPSLRINITYYGLFLLVGLIAEPKAGHVEELAQFRIDYAFFLNLAAIAVTVALVWLGFAKESREASKPAPD
jgi:uncharacterized protein